MTREDQHMDHLRAYVRERLTPRQFAQRAGVSYNMALLILNGQRWTSTRRPEGFVYPWPERRSHSTSVRCAYSRSEVAEALAQRAAHGWSYRTLASHMGVSVATAYFWVNGRPRNRNRLKQGEAP